MPRVIPVLLLKDRGLVKTLRFEDPKYIGDPINAVRIFNDKEVDELILLDISATASDRAPDLDHIRRVATEAFMPFAYGGGVRTVEEIGAILSAGAEKVSLNAAALETPGLVASAARQFGCQSVVVSIDVRLAGGAHRVFTRNGAVATGLDPIECARRMEGEGAGEILLNSIDNDGVQEGYDLDLIRAVAEAVSIPIIACGGAGSIEDFAQAIDAGAAAAAAGSFFVFCGSREAILITYPTRRELEFALGRTVAPGRNI